MLIQSLSSNGLNEAIIPLLFSNNTSPDYSVIKKNTYPTLLLVSLFSVVPLLIITLRSASLIESLLCLAGFLLYGISAFFFFAEITISNLSRERAKAAVLNLIGSTIIPSLALIVLILSNNPVIYPIILGLVGVVYIFGYYPGKASMRGYFLQAFSAENKSKELIKTSLYTLFSTGANWLSGLGLVFVNTFLLQPPLVKDFSIVYTLASSLGVFATLMNQAWIPKLYNTFKVHGVQKAETINEFYYTLLAAMMTIIAVVMYQTLPWWLAMMNIKSVNLGFASFSFALLIAAYLTALPWYHCQDYFYLLGKVKSISMIISLSAIIPYAAYISIFFGFPYIYVPAIAFSIQSAMRAILGEIVISRVATLRPPLFQTVSSLAIFSGILYAVK